MKKELLMHITIESIVKNRLNKVNLDTNRSLRELIDYGKNFSRGRFQKYYLDLMQAALNNDNSSYFFLIKKLAHDTEQQRLLDFSINLGYDSWTYHAKTIRKKIDELNINIPWSITINSNDNTTLSSEDFVVNQGLELGINSYVIITESKLCLERALKLAEGFPSSCFFILTKSEFCKSFPESTAKNYLILLDYDDNFNIETFKSLVKKGMLIGIYTNNINLDNFDVKINEIIKNEIIIAFLKKDKLDDQVYQKIYEKRQAAESPLILVDMEQDFIKVNEIINNHSTLLYVSNNQVTIWSQKNGFSKKTSLNPNTNSLIEILKANKSN